MFLVKIDRKPFGQPEFRSIRVLRFMFVRKSLNKLTNVKNTFILIYLPMTIGVGKHWQKIIKPPK